MPIVIVDPSTLFREGLRRILTDAGFNAVWCGELPPTGPIHGLSEQAPLLLIVGSHIDTGCLHVDDMKRIHPNTRAVVLADSVTQDQFIKALRCGAETMVLKQSSCDALIATLRLVATGAAVFPTGMLESLVTQPAGAAIVIPRSPPVEQRAAPDPAPARPLGNLSPREAEVLDQLLRGLSNKAIARQLDITEATVKVHVKAIFRKAKVNSRLQVVMWASQRQGEAPRSFAAD